MADQDKPNELTTVADLLNYGLKCHDCNSAHIVYCITVPNPFFDLGTYCYNCLLKRCKSTKRFSFSHGRDLYMIPMPMEWNLLTRIKIELGMEENEGCEGEENVIRELWRCESLRW